jgi:hypothetical protein
MEIEIALLMITGGFIAVGAVLGVIYWYAGHSK